MYIPIIFPLLLVYAPKKTLTLLIRSRIKPDLKSSATAEEHVTYWLVVEPTPLKNMGTSVGMMKFPTEWKNKIHVPNHQSAYLIRSR